VLVLVCKNFEVLEEVLQAFELSACPVSGCNAVVIILYSSLNFSGTKPNFIL